MKADIKIRRPEDVIRWAYEIFGPRLVMTSSFGADSAVLLHMASDIVPNIPVIFINTGYVFPETLIYITTLTERLSLNVKIFSSQWTPETLEREFGKLWEQGEEGMRKYNNLVKVLPLDVALCKLKATAMLSGVRAEQTENRAKMEMVYLGRENVFRINPLLSWCKSDVDNYFNRHNLPKHPLVAQGYESIGDTHSTIPGKGREGRLLGVKKECGIHLPEYEI
jgi:phosphoadenosine phosphosulfate reductase